jgi:ubiquinone/menaquinone biosynthesis C-methylase UbiE
MRSLKDSHIKEMEKSSDTSWETSSSWYDKIVGPKGHYYHQQIIIPSVLRLLKMDKKTHPHLLDLACGQGILSRHLPKGMKYLGIDASHSLIEAAKKYEPKSPHQFFVHDLSHPLDLHYKEFSQATCILAIQNLAHPLELIRTAFEHLRKTATFIIVLNHPCYRIPRQSSWGVDEQKKLQYRRVDRYMSPLKIPIQTQPSKQESEQTWSFHHPLSHYTSLLKQAGFVLDVIEEWCSDKKSTGKNAAMENRSRQEFPLFMTLVARKL